MPKFQKADIKPGLVDLMRKMYKSTGKLLKIFDIFYILIFFDIFEKFNMVSLVMINDMTISTTQLVFFKL